MINILEVVIIIIGIIFFTNVPFGSVVTGKTIFAWGKSAQGAEAIYVSAVGFNISHPGTLTVSYNSGAMYSWLIVKITSSAVTGKNVSICIAKLISSKG